MKRFQMYLRFLCFAALGLVGPQVVRAQQAPGTLPGTQQAPPAGMPDPKASGYKLIPPAGSVSLSPGVLQLLDLEGRFAEDVATGGGKAFGTWFAEDAVTLNNGKPAVLGRGDCRRGGLGSEEVHSDVGGAGCADGSVERYGVYVGAL